MNTGAFSRNNARRNVFHSTFFFPRGPARAREARVLIAGFRPVYFGTRARISSRIRGMQYGIRPGVSARVSARGLARSARRGARTWFRLQGSRDVGAHLVADFRGVSPGSDLEFAASASERASARRSVGGSAAGPPTCHTAHPHPHPLHPFRTLPPPETARPLARAG